MPINLSIEYPKLEHNYIKLLYENEELKKCLAYWLAVINRSPAALYHYGEVIDLTEKLLQNEQ